MALLAPGVRIVRARFTPSVPRPKTDESGKEIRCVTMFKPRRRRAGRP
jgi:hypothetical protein